MSNSEIFEKYAEIALEKGLISKADSKQKLESGTGADSLDISAIEALYGVKPDAPKNMQYENNIMERAHPNAVIVSPSYDKLNGLVENNIERQNIMLNIVNKPVDGHSTQHKYANELMLSLVSVANHMDNVDHDELRVLADRCIEQINKKAFWGKLGVTAALAILGGLYAQQHLDMGTVNFKENANRLIKELKDFLGTHLIGTEYTKSFQAFISKVINRIEFVLNTYNQFKSEIDELQTPKDLQELQLYVSTNKVDFHKIYQSFNEVVSKAETLFKQIDERFQDDSWKTEQMASIGIGEKINKFFGGALSGDKLSVASDDFKDVLRALAPFRSSLESTVNLLKDADAKAESDLKNLKVSYEQQLNKSRSQPSSKPSGRDAKPAAIPVNIDELMEHPDFANLNNIDL